ncbi:MAG: tRNA (adenosine(37)-N6)-threonylcarbamoyltransferase complex transferase subunit TsaD [Acidobacteria bacterium]|nr:tRNA (adenosine(37)-N6)-threonylcarbamoyltransferase complex transferase subunit TsaD [Acidobacteriota bacterium]MBI3657173.1 tRNA (adenosine(37)-N6)-threonylcarbamoyltransferase complex transferase subunit TsaD [Acidobacteriota bacterium]
MYTLGIESSCDETAAAVLKDAREVLSNVVASQVGVHKDYGGVVPELASREHIKNICYVVDRALTDAHMANHDLDGIAVTNGPGLIGSLLVGVSYAKALAYSLNKPLVPINHIEGHIYSAFLEHTAIEYPLLALVVSGGHTALYFSPQPEKYKLIGKTRDDAAGEAFDKVAKLLGLGYPGGPIIDKLAEKGNPRAVKFSPLKITDGRLDFSFSGLKTAVLRFVELEKLRPVEASMENISGKVLDLLASFQYAAVRTLLDRAKRAAQLTKPCSIILTGGVACNRLLRVTFKESFAEMGLPVYYPSPSLTTDNAAMIAAAGYPKLVRRLFGKRGRGRSFLPLDLNAYSNLKLA